MSELLPSSRLLNTLSSTYARRSLIRNRLARGRWWECEPDAQRLAGYKARLKVFQTNSEELPQGEISDYQGTALLAIGALTRRAIAYVEINSPNSFIQATGFLIGGGLFITNNHIIRNVDDALKATVSFDRELDHNLRPLTSTVFRLDPDRFFVTSAVDKLDYTVVALGECISGNATQADLHYCALSPLRDKHILGMNMNIIQHPKGQYKQIAIRNNLLTYRTQNTLLYETDTAVGSSGSPVFNDMWEVIALHHWGEPYLANTDIPDTVIQSEDESFPIHANEGIRISAIHESLAQLLPTLNSAQYVLLEIALNAYRNTDFEHREITTNQHVFNESPLSSYPVFIAPEETTNSRLQMNEQVMQEDSSNQVALTVPLEIIVRLGVNGSTTGSVISTIGSTVVPATKSTTTRLNPASESVRVDTNYANRLGYQSNFIPSFEIPLPGLSGALMRQVAPLRESEISREPGLLDYEHFSLKMHMTRRVAIYTATNIDGDTYRKINRETNQIVDSHVKNDTWYKDSRMSESFWLGQDFYNSCSDYFDRGHLTRSTDSAWGTPEEAMRANKDTFHFTNCSPQHFRFNESAQYWQGVERYILETDLLDVQGSNARLIVIQGPIYNDHIDFWIDNEIQIPSSYWKVVIWKGSQGLKSVGLVVDQLQLLSETRVYLCQNISTINVSQWRVHISDIARRTGLTFSSDIIQADTIGQPKQPQSGAEAVVNDIRINGFEDIIL